MKLEPITTVEALENKIVKTPIPPVQDNESKEISPIIEPTLDTTNIDADTGEVLEYIPTTEEEQTKTLSTQTEQQIPTFDRETMIYLATLLDNKIEIA